MTKSVNLKVRTGLDAEDEVLSLFPFVVLEKLFSMSSPDDVGIQRAQALRARALQLGILDVILMCVAHFAHHEPRFEALRPSDMEQPSELVSFDVLSTMHHHFRSR